MDKKQLLATIQFNKQLTTGLGKGVLTTEEVQQLLDKGKTRIEVYSNGQVFFFTDNYCLLPSDIDCKGLVPSSSACPMSVAPRKGLEDSIIKNAKDFILVFEYNARQLTTIDELAEYLTS